jgi:glyoxylase-like metal-dependent hydrolase (beta-lactamase superfamily II)
MRIQPFYDARTFTLSYVVFDPQTRDAIAIDPVLDYEPVGSFTYTESVDRLSDFVRNERLRLHWVLETHAHADHLSAAQILRRRFDAKVAIGAPITAVQETFKDLLALDHLATDGSQFDRLLREGDVVVAGTVRVEVIATPGHTPACMTYRVGDALFTGDLLFMDDYGTGRCDFPGGSATAMYDSVQKLYALPGATQVYPGHDYPPAGRTWRHATTLDASKDHNPQLSGGTTRDAFVAMRTARDRGLASPKLLFPSIQVNVDGGRMPPLRGGRRYLVTPINLFRPADDIGEPTSTGRASDE